MRLVGVPGEVSGLERGDPGGEQADRQLRSLDLSDRAPSQSGGAGHPPLDRAHRYAGEITAADRSADDRIFDEQPRRRTSLATNASTSSLPGTSIR